MVLRSCTHTLCVSSDEACTASGLFSRLGFDHHRPVGGSVGDVAEFLAAGSGGGGGGGGVIYMLCGRVMRLAVAWSVNQLIFEGCSRIRSGWARVSRPDA